MISRVSGLLMLPSETQSRGRVQQMRQHRSLDEHDPPKGDRADLVKAVAAQRGGAKRQP